MYVAKSTLPFYQAHNFFKEFLSFKEMQNSANGTD